MSVDVTKINTGGAVVTVGGYVNSVDGDGYYWGTVSGIDVGCTTGGVTVSYNYEKNDIFCDQSLSAVETSIISETATVSLNMLETSADKIKLALQNYTSTDDATEYKVAVGGKRTITYVPVKLEVTDEDDSALLTTWTFFRCATDGFEVNFERDNPSQLNVTFNAYADTAKAVGHQLFSVHQALT